MALKVDRLSQSILIRLSVLFCTLMVICQSCIPPSKEIKSDVAISILDKEVQKLLSFQDQLLSDSIYPYLHSDDPTLVYLAIRSFASVQDKKAIDSIVGFLDNPNMDVRAITAYTLGQLGEERATEPLINGFIDQDTLDVDNILNSNILEALGKISNQAIMSNVASVESYRADDTTLLIGQTRSLYRFGLRGITNQDATKAVMKYILDDTYTTKTRVMAANFIARNKDLDLDIYRDEMLRMLRKDNNPNIRMCLAIAMKNLKNDPTLANELITSFDREKDYRVKCYLIKSLGEFPYINVIEPIMAMTTDLNTHVALTAAQYLVNKGNATDSNIYKGLIKESMPWQVKAKIYEALMKHTPIYYTRVKNVIKKEIQDLIEQSKDNYTKAAYIAALSQDPYQYTTLLEYNNASKSDVLKTAIAEGLKRQIESPLFIKAFGGNYIRVARSIADSLIVEAKKGGSGVVATLAGVLNNDQFAWNTLIRDTSWKEDIVSSLKLPRDTEAYNEIKGAIAKIEGKTFAPSPPQYNHPINWTLLSSITDSSRMVMKTSKGNITIELYPDEAPGSVANFVDLCQSDYYDGKTFHRVVPNFVIQGGCPIGDGYGGLDYTIRSELSPQYYDDEGYIGMASAGNHTEGVQFFITHSPTPHLDGRYTIFGKVTNGMEVVHEIQVGDKIIDAILTYQ